MNGPYCMSEDYFGDRTSLTLQHDGIIVTAFCHVTSGIIIEVKNCSGQLIDRLHYRSDDHARGNSGRSGGKLGPGQ
jgi:hypothetical protein